MRVLLAMLFSLNSFAQALDQHSHAGRPRLTAVEQTNLNNAVLDSYIQHFNTHVHNSRDLEALLKSRVKDTKELKKLLEDIGPAPRLSREGNDLVIEFGSNKIHIKWPNLAERHVLVEGLSFAFDPSESLAVQSERLRRHIGNALGEHSAGLMNLLLPSADAQAQVLLIPLRWLFTSPGLRMWLLGVLTAGPAYDIVKDAPCMLIDTVRVPLPIWCSSYKDKKDASLRQTAAGLIANAPKDPNLKWTPDKDLQCPQKGSDGIFKSWMAPVRLNSDGIWVTEPWFRFSATSKDGKFTEAYVYNDMNKKNVPENADVQFVFSKNPVMKDHSEIEAIKIRRAKFTGQPFDTEFVTILATDRSEAVPVLYRDRVIRMVSLIESAQTWAQTCQNMAFMSKYSKDSGHGKNATEVSDAMQQQPVVTPPPPTDATPVSK